MMKYLIILLLCLSCTKKPIVSPSGISVTHSVIPSTKTEAPLASNIDDFFERFTPDPIQFDYDKHEVNADQMVMVDLMAKRWKDGCQLNGYASQEGAESYNLSLSQKRTLAVRDELEALGVRVHKMAWYGESDPVTTDDSKYWMNRRVEMRCEGVPQ